MRVGDLIQTNMWFSARKKWDQKRVGLIVDKSDPPGTQFEIMWRDDPSRLQWLTESTLNPGGTHGVSTRVIS